MISILLSVFVLVLLVGAAAYVNDNCFKGLLHTLVGFLIGTVALWYLFSILYLTWVHMVILG